MTEPTAPDEVTRRALVRGAAVGGLALPLLAACGGGGDSSNSPAAGASSQGGSTDQGGSAGQDGSADQGGSALATTADVPVGGGTILAGPQVVLTQPTKGSFKAFSAICTHQGCPVNKIEGGDIVCPCHGSMFSIEDGSVVGGPAPKPLPPVKIAVKGDRITRA